MEVSRTKRRLSEQRKTRKGFFSKGIILTAIFLIFAIGTYAYFSGNLAVNKLKRASLLASDMMIDHTKVNILVLGVDERDGDRGRSDTMFVVTVDPNKGKVNMLSIPRDTRVKIPGHGWEKINHAYAYGKEDLAEKAVEGLLGVPMDYYIKVNFNSFYKIIDALGGVTIDIDKRMYYADPYDDLVIDFRAGEQYLDGKEAIKYVRYRDSEGDIGRIERQQKFVAAVLDQASSPLLLPRIPGIISEISEVIDTDLSISDMLSLAQLIKKAQGEGLTSDILPGRGAYVNNVSYWLPDMVQLREHLAEIFGVSAEHKYVKNATAIAKEYKESIPKEMHITDEVKTIKKANKEVVKDKDAKDTSSEKKIADDETKDNKKQNTTKVKKTGITEVEIINASGSALASEIMESELKKQGFDVVSITNVDNVNRNTLVMAYTTNSVELAKVNNLSFKHAFQINKDESKSNTLSIIIGKDYLEKVNKR